MPLREPGQLRVAGGVAHRGGQPGGEDRGAGRGDRAVRRAPLAGHTVDGARHDHQVGLGAAALGLVMLSVSFLMLLTINALNGWRMKRFVGRR